MNMLSKVKVVRTIWPYEDGWGVVIKHPFKVDVLIDSGIEREEAMERAALIKQQLKNKEVKI